MSTADLLRTAIAELAALRESDRMISQAVKDARAQWERDHDALLTAKTDTAVKLAEAETQVRALALVVFEQTGEKKAVEGASVVIRVAHTYDKGQALAWAKEHMPQLVTETLDVKAFDKIAAAGGFTGAQKVETPAVTIATDLSTYIVKPDYIIVEPDGSETVFP